MTHVPDPAHPEPEGTHKKAPSDILASHGLIAFLIAYLKELKNESGLVIQISQATQQVLETFRYGLHDMHKLPEEHLKQLKESILEHPGHFILRKLLNPDFNQGAVDYLAIGKSVISALVDIAAKKLPSDITLSNKQLDQVTQKIKFLPHPKNIFDEPIYDEDNNLVQEKNTNERAIVRLRIPKRKVEESFVEFDENTGAESARVVERVVEIDIDDKVLIFPSMVGGRDYSIIAFNQSAPRAHRREFFASIKKAFGDYFEGRDPIKDFDAFTKRTEQMYEAIERRFLDETVDEDNMPLLDFEINLNEGE
jgi:hypothetical protein